MAKLKSGASVPMLNRAKILESLNKVAEEHSVDPAAIAGVIYTESVWDTKCVTGKYIGLTQIGPEITEALRLTRKEFLNLSAAEQIDAYGFWLNFYRFQSKMVKLNIRTLKLPLARQAAVLQGMQFAPNASGWKTALAKGDRSVPTTGSPQAEVLGDTSIGDMENYYTSFFKKKPPAYQ